MLDNPFEEEVLSDIQPEPLQAQLEAVCSCPVTTWEKRPNPTWLQPPFRADLATVMVTDIVITSTEEEKISLPFEDCKGSQNLWSC